MYNAAPERTMAQPSAWKRMKNWLWESFNMECCLYYPFEKLYGLVVFAVVVGFSPFAAFAHMLARFYSVDVGSMNSKSLVWLILPRTMLQLILVLWSAFSACLPFLLTLWVIPHYVVDLGKFSIRLTTLICLSCYFLVSIFLPVFFTLRKGWDWKIIDTRYRYHGVMNFHVVQKIQQILGPMVSIAELNWGGDYDVTGLVEDVHVAIYGNAEAEAGDDGDDVDSLTVDPYAAINRRTDLDAGTRQRLAQLITDMRTGDVYIQRAATSLQVRINLVNVIALSHIAIEFLQFLAISTYHAGSSWLISFFPDGSVPDKIVQPINSFGISILAFTSSTLNRISFWLIVALVGIWLAVTYRLHWASFGDIFCPGADPKRWANSQHNDDEEDDDDDDPDAGITPIPIRSRKSARFQPTNQIHHRRQSGSFDDGEGPSSSSRPQRAKHSSRFRSATSIKRALGFSKTARKSSQRPPRAVVEHMRDDDDSDDNGDNNNNNHYDSDDGTIATTTTSQNNNQHNTRLDAEDAIWLQGEQQWYQAAQAITRTRFQRIALFLTSDVAFFAIVIKLCGFLSCNYDSKDKVPHMTQVPDVECLQGNFGILYGVVAMLGLLYYVFTSFCYTNMQCEVRSEIVKDFDIQFDHQFTGLERLIKLAGAVVMALFGSFDYIPQAVSIFCACALLLLLSRQASCTAFFLDFWRPIALWVVVYSSLVSAVVVGTNATSYGAYAMGLGSILITVSAVGRWRRIVVHVKNARAAEAPMLESVLVSNASRDNLRPGPNSPQTPRGPTNTPVV